MTGLAFNTGPALQKLPRQVSQSDRGRSLPRAHIHACIQTHHTLTLVSSVCTCTDKNTCKSQAVNYETTDPYFLISPSLHMPFCSISSCFFQSHTPSLVNFYFHHSPVNSCIYPSMHLPFARSFPLALLWSLPSSFLPLSPPYPNCLICSLTVFCLPQFHSLSPHFSLSLSLSLSLSRSLSSTHSCFDSVQNSCLLSSLKTLKINEGCGGGGGGGGGGEEEEEGGRRRQLHSSFQLNSLRDCVRERVCVRARGAVGMYAEAHVHICIHTHTHTCTQTLSVCLLGASPSTVSTGWHKTQWYKFAFFALQ